MKKTLLAAMLALAVAGSGMAQGYKDGIEYYKVDRLDNAKELLERNLNAAGTNKAEAFYYLGQIAFKQGDIAGATAYFDKGVAADQACALNYIGQAAVALKQGANAKPFMEQARKSAKKNCYVEMEIARVLYAADPVKNAKEIEKCVKNARKWSAEDPNSFIFEGDMKADKKDWGGAASQYEWAFTYDPNNVEAYVKYANTYFNVVPAYAIKRLEEIDAKQPGNALVQRELAEKYYSDNLGSKAAEKYGEYIKNPNHFAQDEVRYVQLLFFGDKFTESYDLATSLLSRLKDGDPNIFFMRRMQLYNKVKMEDWSNAAKIGDAFFATPVPKGASFNVTDYTNYAEALDEMDRDDDAIKAYEAALSIKPDDLDMMRMLSGAYTSAGQFQKAVELYQRVVDNPEHKANDLFQLARRYYNLAIDANEKPDAYPSGTKEQSLAKALDYLYEVNEKVPGNIPIHDQIANTLRLQEGENKGKAAQTYKNLLALLDQKEDKSDYANYYIKAYSYLAQDAFNRGDKAAAKDYYTKWLEYDPDNTALRDYVKNLK